MVAHPLLTVLCNRIGERARPAPYLRDGVVEREHAPRRRLDDEHGGRHLGEHGAQERALALERREEALLLRLRALPGRDVGEEDRHAARGRRADAEGVHVVPAAERRGERLEARRLAGEGDAAIGLEPVRLVRRRELAHRPSDGARKSGLLNEGRVDLEEPVVGRALSSLVVRLEQHLDDAESFVDGVVQRAVARLTRAQRVVRLPPRGEVAGRADPLGDLTIGAQQRDRARERPAERPVGADDPVLEREHTARPHCRGDCRRHARFVVGVDVALNPGGARLRGVRDEAAAVELAHLAPVGAHAVEHVRAGRRERTVARLARAQRRLGPRPLDRRPRALGRRLDERDLVRRPRARRPLVDRQRGHQPPAPDQRHHDARADVVGTVSRALIVRQRGVGVNVSDDPRSPVREARHRPGGERVTSRVARRPRAIPLPLDDELRARLVDLDVAGAVGAKALAQHTGGRRLYRRRVVQAAQHVAQ